MRAFMERAEDTLRRLGTDKDRGLDSAQVSANRRQYGANVFTKEKPLSLSRRVWDAAREPMIIMLIMAAAITLGVNLIRGFTGGEADFLECAGIFVAISLSVIITVAMEGRSAKAFEELNKIGEDALVKVVREGRTELLSRKEIVVGDIVLAGTGDKLAADGRLIESSSLQSDESSLTGESAPASKDAGSVFDDGGTPVAERVNMLYSGCFITGGNGKMIVTEVGDGTEFGRIAKELSSVEKMSTPLQEKIGRLGKTITVLGGIAAAAVFAIQIVTLILNGAVNFDAVSQAFITSIILIVAAVPEGLPTIVAVSLAVNIIKMSKQNALVKKMVACETVGCVNIICSDKTGTLTENRMTVTDVYADGSLLKPDGLKNEMLLKNFCVNSTADVYFEDARPKFIGNPTECALLAAAAAAGWDYKEQRSQSDVVRVFPFSSEEKDMTTIVKHDDGKYISYTKGSPEKIISLCRMSASQKSEIEKEIISFQEKACRVIGFAHKIFDPEQDFVERKVERDMHFDGFAAITDPLRSDVKEAVQRGRQAGIEMIMLTGDNIVTATAIANELCLLDGEHSAVEAKVLEPLSDEEFSGSLAGVRVIARSTPSIKMRVVNALKAQGNVVAVTGDGINDAPAIKNADVGIAMGISGTEVSKESSDIVLLDDSFSTIIKAVQWGRGIYENFQRFILFQLTVNLSAVIVVLSSVLAGFASPFTALQLLWINIVMDGPPALTLGLEPIRGDLMQREPTKRNASIVTKGMLQRVVFNGLFISAVFMAQRAWNFLDAAPEQESTILFTLFVVFQLVNALNCRELNGSSVFRNMLDNRLMLTVFSLTFALQVVITQFGGALYSTVPLPLSMWLKIIGVSLTVIFASEIFKLQQKQPMKIRTAQTSR